MTFLKYTEEHNLNITLEQSLLLRIYFQINK